MTRVTAVLILLSCVPGASGCSDDAAGPSNPDQRLPRDGQAADAALEVATPEAAAPDAAPGADAAPKAQYCGVLKSAAGAAVRAEVLVCNEHICHPGESAATGAFCVQVEQPGDYLFHALGNDLSGVHYGDMMFPVALSASELLNRARIDLGTVTLPEVGAAQDLNPTAGGTLDLGPGQLTVPPGATVLPPLATEAKVALAVLDPGALHPRLVAAVPDGKPVAAAFVIIPVGVTFSAPVSFELPAPQGLAADVTLEVHRVHDELGTLELRGEATVDATGKLVPVPGKGLTALGVLVLTKK